MQKLHIAALAGYQKANKVYLVLIDHFK